MAKKKAVKKKTTAVKKASTSRTPNLKALQASLRRQDRELVKQLNARTQIARQIADSMQSADSPSNSYTNLDTEETLSKVCQNSQGVLPDTSLRAIFRELITGSRQLERKLKVAMLGPLYSYSHLAAIHRFGQDVEFVPVGTIAAVFEEVHRRHSDYGIVPIENSTDGRIADTLDMFTKLPLRICDEVELRIHHALLGKCTRPNVQEVYSRPQALSQCRNWLAKHLPGARLIEVTSTTTAAQLAKKKPGATAIASLQAGVHYDLDILAEQIEDNPNNVTRFAVIGERSGKRTGHDKTAIMFQITHRFGALVEALSIFKRSRLNLTWIESFPIPASEERTYLFFVELEGHETDTRVRKAIDALQKKATRLEILGSYGTSPIVG